MTLYEIDMQIMSFIELFDSGKIPEEAVNDTFESLEGGWKRKVDNIASYIKSINSTAEAIKKERDTLNARIKSLESKSNRLSNMLYESMINKGYDTADKKLETPRNVIKVQNNPPMVVIRDIDKVPCYLDIWEYHKPTINKAKLKKLIEEGREIDGVEIIQNKSLRIR